ncbi:MAG: hypothetical protein GX768_08710 [Chloroflexi bacterium]|jgi:hypothetical protein|nr:hypothetical protein [Chloroflexota bacterium]
MDLLAGNVFPAEGESTVRTYHCTYYREKALGLQSGGFLGVTNKRVIFQAAGDTPSGRSLIQSEVPIADVSGINSFKGTYFNFFAMLGALLLAWLAMLVVPAILTGLSYMLESYTFFQVIGWLLAIGALLGSFFLSVKSIWRTVLVGVSAGALLSLAGIGVLDALSAITGGGGGDFWILFLLLGALIYMLMCASWYARRPTFFLEINSSGGSSTPIRIASAGGFMNMAAINTPNALPGRDAETMLHEIGALITDIQTLGDYGIAKWKQN